MPPQSPTHFLTAFTDATLETLSAMSGLVMEPQTTQRQSLLEQTEVAGLMPVTGALTGAVALGMSRALAVQVVSQLLGRHRLTADQVQAGVLELLNIIVGQASGNLEDSDHAFSFSTPPVVVARAPDELVASAHAETWVLPFATNDQTILVEIYVNPTLSRPDRTAVDPAPSSD